LYECTVEQVHDLPGAEGLGAGLVVTLGTPFTFLGQPEMKNIEVDECTFKNNVFPVSVFTDFGSPNFVEKFSFTDNIVVRDAGTRPNDVELFIDRTLNATFTGNDYTDTTAPGIPGNGARGGVMVLFFDTIDCLVKETGLFPVGLGGPGNFITNLGLNNRVVGEEASALEAPKGVGAVMSQARKRYGTDATWDAYLPPY
jgi:hypothetical protein